MRTDVLLCKGRGVEIVFIDDARIANLAGTFRGSKHPTDVLAFSYDDPDVNDEIAVSLDTARRQARERGVPLAHELILLCVHGLLHIGGQGDENFRDWCVMRKKEFAALIKLI